MRNSSQKNCSNAGCEIVDIDEIQDRMKDVHISGVNLSYAWRMKQLKRLLCLIQENTEAIRCALSRDLGRQSCEAICIEIKPLESDIKMVMRNLRKWMERKAVPSPLVMFPSFSYIESKPLDSPGVLIIASYNYPVRMMLQPLLGVLAGGNPAVVKPSELCPTSALLMKDLLGKYFPEPGVVQVVLGGVPETTALLKRPWSKVFFTGSERVGRIVQKACAETLTPTILELGGKCPIVVDETISASHLRNVADRIVFSKFLNAGQTCVAPDTLFVHKSHAKALCRELVHSIETQYGKNQKLGEIARIVDSRNTLRLIGLIEDAKKLGTKVFHGGCEKCDLETRYICPTILLNPPVEARILQEEIFGPVLPIVSFSSRKECIGQIKDLPGTPLSVYIFTPSTDVFQEYTDECRSAAAFQNDAVVQGSSPYLPLGGLGSSGIGGNYFGKASFDAFTHVFPVAYRPLGSFWDLWNVRCHPYGTGPGTKGWLLENVLMNLPDVPVMRTRTFLMSLLFTAILCTTPPLPDVWRKTLISLLETILASLKD